VSCPYIAGALRNFAHVDETSPKGEVRERRSISRRAEHEPAPESGHDDRVRSFHLAHQQPKTAKVAVDADRGSQTPYCEPETHAN